MITVSEAVIKIAFFPVIKTNCPKIYEITAYPNEAIHDDCVVAFTGGYEKIANETQSQRVDVDKWYST